MNLKGELHQCAKKDQDREAISGIVMKTFPDIKGWLDIKKRHWKETKKEIKTKGPSTFLGIFTKFSCYIILLNLTKNLEPNTTFWFCCQIWIVKWWILLFTLVYYCSCMSGATVIIIYVCMYACVCMYEYIYMYMWCYDVIHMAFKLLFIPAGLLT